MTFIPINLFHGHILPKQLEPRAAGVKGLSPMITMMITLPAMGFEPMTF